MPLPLWTRTRLTRALTTRLLPPADPPVLLLSLPRSGSTWIGGLLGQARDALYLHEPFSQSYLRSGGKGSFVDPDHDGAPPGYQSALARVLRGDPTFPRDLGIVDDRRAWRLLRRRGARVVVKEVNPCAAGWFVRHLDPRVILLARHPIAIALSFERRGWTWPGRDRVVQWRRMGRQFADAMAGALAVIGDARDHRIVGYEDVCAAPHEHFPALVGFAGLRWDARLAGLVRRAGVDTSASTPGASGAGAGSRADAWRARLDEDGVPADAVDALRENWMAAELPWYRDDADWPR